MDPVFIFELIEKGITTIPVLIEAGINITQRIQQLAALAKGGADGTITADELAKIRAQFDADLDDFNKPMA